MQKTTENKYKDDSYLSTFSPIEVKVIQSLDGRIDESIHRFRALVTKERVMSSLKEHYEYEKPSDKKRRKQRESIARNKKIANTYKTFGGKSTSTSSLKSKGGSGSGTSAQHSAEDISS